MLEELYNWTWVHQKKEIEKKVKHLIFKNEFANSLKNGKIYIREIVEKWKNIFVNSWCNGRNVKNKHNKKVKSAAFENICEQIIFFLLIFSTVFINDSKESWQWILYKATIFHNLVVQWLVWSISYKSKIFQYLIFFNNEFPWMFSHSKGR